MQHKDYEKRFKAFFDHSAIAMQVFSKSGECVVANKAWEDMYETTRDQLEGYNIFNDEHLKSLPAWDGVMRAFQGESVIQEPVWYDPAKIGKVGRGRWIEAWISPVKDESGEVQEIACILKDVTERCQHDADLEFLSKASEILNGTSLADEILLKVSEYATTYLCDGVVIDELLSTGEMVRVSVVHQDKNMVEKIYSLKQTLQMKESMDCHLNSFSDIDAGSCIRVHFKGRDKLLGMVTFFSGKNSAKKISQRSRWVAQELVSRAGMAYENALMHQKSREAINSRDEFLSVASHELKTPLQSLTLQNQMRKRNLIKGLFGPIEVDKLEAMVDSDLKHLMRINRLIEDMLDISRVRAGQLSFINESVEFCSFAKDVLERFRPQLDAAGCYLTTSFCSPVYTEIDTYRVEQVVVNLLTNAIKYASGRPIDVEVCLVGAMVQLRVHDQGPGISENNLERIFDRYERAISSNEVSGLGLGLYIARQIMEQNRGSLKVLSTQGKGSTFIIEIPYRDVD
jgi:PAS domain S-box-containing protein